MFIFIGLGNPGIKYQNTRHNFGQRALLYFWQEEKSKFNFTSWRLNKKLKSKLAQGHINRQKILLAIPLTFMNQSGEAVKKIKSFFKITSKQIWIIYDDLDLPLGKIRIRLSGSSGGHKGMNSIINNLKTEKIPRIRLGIYNHPLKKTQVEKFVLSKFNSQEEKIVKKVLKNVTEAIKLIVDHKQNKAMSLFNKK